ncbi:hypothetical protein GCM10007962_02030 [Yeosuana aromativorans]|uniref:DUF3857 domain-containing protein n=1 Tax=Yeosuana aromativorans TaxID=288019 RepID=A0A8J3BIN8_9FLAO|nr:DUF3857 domain-containing transglutaminase family protein [Yeosuana aromativorans]GGK11389.1 hypothetical protein GCM10007962_02030 [Yeosuana aromativorans]
MNIKNTFSILLLFLSLAVFSQDSLYLTSTIPEDLKKNANTVIRLHDIDISLNSSSDMSIKERRIVTVLNKEGNDNVDAYVHYDNNVKIVALEALVFNKFGALIKKVRKKDFRDVSAVDGGTLYSDSRVKYLEYTPISYPYTIEFNCEINTENTAFIESFSPIDDYFVSVENSNYNINFPSDIVIRTKEKNLNGATITKEELPNKIGYTAKNLIAIKPEEYSPSLIDVAPRVLVSSNKFTLEGVQTEVTDWADFGKWMYNDLLKDTYDLPASTIAHIQNLVKDETDDIAKAKKIYEYVQDKTRYISVQVGIGGWKPFNASEVDKLGYGDCKALTNYTLSLLKAAGIKSNYTVVYAGSSQRSLETDFTAMQGNHVILNIPTEKDTIWLECTNQQIPFGFIGDFTDDRDVLVVTPEGGKIEHTKKYTANENVQYIKGRYTVSNEGNIEVKVSETSKGIQYDNKFFLDGKTERDLDTYYKKRWRYINGMSITDLHITNDKSAVEFIEDISFKATNYTKKAGNRMLLSINALNRNLSIPDHYKDRKLPLKINRGFKDIDEVEVRLPQDYKVEFLPKGVAIENKFGSYKTELITKDDKTLVYKREFKVNEGDFPKEDYEAFRDFYKEVSKHDNAKVALIKT